MSKDWAVEPPFVPIVVRRDGVYLDMARLRDGEAMPPAPSLTMGSVGRPGSVGQDSLARWGCVGATGLEPVGYDVTDRENSDHQGAFAPDKHDVFGGQVDLDAQFQRVQEMSDEQLEAELRRLIESTLSRGDMHKPWSVSVIDGATSIQLPPRAAEALREILAAVDTERAREWFDQRANQPPEEDVYQGRTGSVIPNLTEGLPRPRAPWDLVMDARAPGVASNLGQLLKLALKSYADATDAYLPAELLLDIVRPVGRPGPDEQMMREMLPLTRESGLKLLRIDLAAGGVKRPPGVQVYLPLFMVDLMEGLLNWSVGALPERLEVTSNPAEAVDDPGEVGEEEL